MENEPPEGIQEQVAETLEELNTNMKKQVSIRHMFFIGMIYGVGFIIGSTVVAVVLLHILGVLFGDVPLLENIVDIVRTKK